ncbi:unnamed protein product [Prorocentrum cordatum]|uniref:Uncharacterized protein n=1 Tax=Prorocentrum cordatum TaxID=2364126 RepID=A0ABN9TH89_9DINO|nr:unnamed protein product [Polarella glacialis]
MTEAKSLRKASSDRQGADLISSLEMEAAQEEISELRDQIQRMQHKPKDKDRLSVLAVVAHHVPAKAGGEARRNSALKETLKAMQEWPLTKMTTYVLTNKLVENAHVKDMVTGQILVSSDEPVCSETWKHKFCVPWEAIRALRSASAGGEPTTKLGFELVGEPKFDFYVYTETSSSQSPPSTSGTPTWTPCTSGVTCCFPCVPRTTSSSQTTSLPSTASTRSA